MIEYKILSITFYLDSYKKKKPLSLHKFLAMVCVFHIENISVALGLCNGNLMYLS